MDKTQVVVAGHICLDVIPSFRKTGTFKFEETFIPGKLINMEKVQTSTGGPVSNTGIALNILGIKTALMGKIGDDFFGEGVQKLLEKRNLSEGMITSFGEDTSYTIVIAPPGHDRIFLHNPGANNTFCAEDINYDLVCEAKLFHFGYPPLMRKIFENEGRELIKIFKKVKSMGVTTSLDMSLPDALSDSGKVDWENLLRNLLPYVDIYLPSVEESLFMIDREKYNDLNSRKNGHDILNNLDMNILPELGKKLLGFGPKILAIKCGVKGFYVTTADSESLKKCGKAMPEDIVNWANRELLEESFYVPEVASATGSGDSSIAGFLAAYLNGKSIEETIKIACAVGGQNVKTFDAISGIKTWKETLDMIPGWGKNKLEIEGDIWKYSNNKKVWIGKRDLLSF